MLLFSYDKKGDFFALGNFFKKVFSKSKGCENESVGFESIVGEKCVVTEKIDNFAGCGIVKVNGQLWAARGAFEADVFEVGVTLRIVAIEGVKLICKKNG